MDAVPLGHSSIIPEMKKTLMALVVVVATYAQVAAQTDTAAFYSLNMARERISRNSMIALGSWGAANMVVGGIGWGLSAKGSTEMYFHQMNLFWNVVNVGIAIPGYIKARKHMRNLKWDAYSTFKDQRGHENVYLINMALDVAYMGTGVWMMEYADDAPTRWQPLLTGYGTSLIMQGGFLLVNDLVVWLMHRANWRRHEAGIFSAMQFNGSAITIPITGKKGRLRRTAE